MTAFIHDQTTSVKILSVQKQMIQNTAAPPRPPPDIRQIYAENHEDQTSEKISEKHNGSVPNHGSLAGETELHIRTATFTVSCLNRGIL